MSRAFRGGRQNKASFQIRPLEDRVVTEQTVDWLKQTGASRDLLAIAQRSAKRAAKRSANA